MPVVLIPSLMRDLSGGLDRVEVEGVTLRQVIRNVDARFPGFADRVQEGDRIRPGLSFAIDGAVVSSGLVEPVPADAQIAIVPQIAGGAGRAPSSATPNGMPSRPPRSRPAP